VLCRVGKNKVFAVQFRLPIPAAGIGGIGLREGALFFAIENIVGAEVDKSRTAPGGAFSHDLRGEGIDRLSLLVRGFAAIHICRAGAVDQNLELHRLKLGAEFFEIRDIRLGPTQRKNLVVFRPTLSE